MMLATVNHMNNNKGKLLPISLLDHGGYHVTTQNRFLTKGSKVFNDLDMIFKTTDRFLSTAE